METAFRSVERNGMKIKIITYAHHAHITGAEKFMLILMLPNIPCGICGSGS